MDEYKRLIADFLADMAAVESPKGEYLDALCDAKYEIEMALDAGREDLAADDGKAS